MSGFCSWIRRLGRIRCARGVGLSLALALLGFAPFGFAQNISRKQITVPGPAGPAGPRLPYIASAPSIQAAIDMAVGPTDIAVTLAESPGFTAQGKDVTIICKNTVIKNAATFQDCPFAQLNNAQAEGLVTFQRCRKGGLVYGSSSGGIFIDECENVGVGQVAVTGGLFVRRSAGASIAYCSFSGAGVTIVDCTAAPPLPYADQVDGQYPVNIDQCKFTKIGPGPAVLLHASKVRVGSNVGSNFSDLGGRAIEAQGCPDVSIRAHTLHNVTGIGIAVFDSQAEVSLNTIDTVNASPTSIPGRAIYVASTPAKDGQQPNRSHVKMVTNTVSLVDLPIVALDSTIDARDNRLWGGLIGIAAAFNSDGVISTGNFNQQQAFGIVLWDLPAAFLVESTEMADVAGYGIYIHGSGQVTLKSNTWSSHGDSAERMSRPVHTGGFYIDASTVKLQWNAVASRMTGAALMAVAGSKVDCSDGSNFTGLPGNPPAGLASGPGVIVDGSTLTGNLGAQGNANVALLLHGGATVNLTGAEIQSPYTPAVVVDDGSTLEIGQGRIIGAAIQGGPRPFVPGAEDTVLVGGKSKLRFRGTTVDNGAARRGVHLTEGSEGSFESCQLSGTRAGDVTMVLANGRLFDGPFEGLVVEGEGTTADVRGGTLQIQRGEAVAVGSGGHAVVADATIRLGDDCVHVFSGGNVELRNCTIRDSTLNSPPLVGTGLRVESGAHAVAQGDTFQFGHTGVWVASGGQCELTGGSIRNHSVGIHAEPGAKVTATGVDLSSLDTPIVGPVKKGD